MILKQFVPRWCLQTNVFWEAVSGNLSHHSVFKQFVLADHVQQICLWRLYSNSVSQVVVFKHCFLAGRFQTICHRRPLSSFFPRETVFKQWHSQRIALLSLTGEYRLFVTQSSIVFDPETIQDNSTEAGEHTLFLCISDQKEQTDATKLVSELAGCRLFWRRCINGVCMAPADLMVNPMQVSGTTANPICNDKCARRRQYFAGPSLHENLRRALYANLKLTSSDAAAWINAFGFALTLES